MADSGRGDDMTRRLTPLIIIIAVIFAVLSALGKTAPSIGFFAAVKRDKSQFGHSQVRQIPVSVGSQIGWRSGRNLKLLFVACIAAFSYDLTPLFAMPSLEFCVKCR